MRLKEFLIELDGRMKQLIGYDEYEIIKQLPAEWNGRTLLLRAKSKVWLVKERDGIVYLKIKNRINDLLKVSRDEWNASTKKL